MASIRTEAGWSVAIQTAVACQNHRPEFSIGKRDAWHQGSSRAQEVATDLAEAVLLVSLNEVWLPFCVPGAVFPERSEGGVRACYTERLSSRCLVFCEV